MIWYWDMGKEIDHMKTVLITGTSSGIGKETAKIFQKNGWNVIATMRSPEKKQELNLLANVKIIKCDVTNSQSIRNAVKEGAAAYGGIDVLVNNAGFDTIGPVETISKEAIKQQINTNLVGMIEMTKEVIPYLRGKKSGTIVNLSSIAGRSTVPMQSLYHATKWGVEGFSESLQYELDQFNIRVKVIEPGVIKTDFYGRSMSKAECTGTDYQAFYDGVSKNLHKNGMQGSSPYKVAETIYKAACDNKRKLRYPTGKSKQLMLIHNLLPFPIYKKLIKTIMA